MADIIPFVPRRPHLTITDTRSRVEGALVLALDTADHLLAILDGMEPRPDDEDGGDAELDLGAPEGHESQVVWLRGTTRDLG